MPAADQPSILTVCLGESAGSSRGSIEQILAARSESRFAPETTSRSILNRDASRQQAQNGLSCDDSACGIDFAGISSEDSSLEKEPAAPNASFFHADSGKKALELLRVLRFDLLVTGDQLPDMTVSQLVHRVRAAWPWQKWALVGSQITPQDEITARTLGAMAVFDAPTDWDALADLAEGIRSRAASAAATATANVGAALSNGYASAFSDDRRTRRIRPLRRAVATRGGALPKAARLDESAAG